MLSIATIQSIGLLASVLTQPDPVAERAVYRLRIDADSPRVLHVEAELPCASAKLSLGEYHPDRPTERWGDYVYDLDITTIDAEPVAWQRTLPNQWTIEGPIPDRLRIRYDLRLEHDAVQWPPSTAESSYVRPDCVFFRTYAVLIATPQVPNARIVLDLPDNWKVITPLAPAPGNTREWRSDNRYQTYNAGMMLGTPATATLEVGNIELDLGVSADLPNAIDTMVPVFEKALREASVILGGTPKSRYALIAAGNLSRPGFSGSGLGNGMSVLLGVNPPDDVGGLWAYVVTHELMHMWCGGTIRNRNSRDEEWFSEGMSEYLTMVISGRTGILRDPVRLSYMGQMWHGYQALSGEVSLTEAAIEKSRFYDFIYGGGMYVALLTDIEIRRATDGERNIEDLMRALNTEFGKTGRDMTSEDFGRVASQVAGKDLNWIIQDFVRGDKVLTADMVLAPLGLTDGIAESSSARPPLVRDPNASAEARALRQAILAMD